MPDIIMHYRFGCKVLSRLSEDISETLCRPLYDLTTVGPDVWFSYRFWRASARQGKQKRADIMQHERSGDFLMALAAQSLCSARAEVFSCLAGYICHYCLDRATHPYIVYHTGEYDGAETTRQYRGNHMYFEHALDLWALSQWGKTLRDAPILKTALRLKRLPDAVRPWLDAAYKSVYGWDDVSADMDRAIFDQRLFYFLAQEPTGMLAALMRLVDNSVSRRDYTALCYYGKEQRGVDVLNEAHRPWRHPNDPTIVSNESFPELCERAAQQAAAMITAAWEYRPGGESVLSDVFGNDSYETGFPWDDPRNAAAPQCAPLSLHKNRRD